MQPKNIWFPAKKYGWGWGPPVCWQGWAVIAVFVGLFSLGGIFLMAKKPSLWFAAYVALLSLLLTFVCWLKGEKPGWRCGGK